MNSKAIVSSKAFSSFLKEAIGKLNPDSAPVLEFTKDNIILDSWIYDCECKGSGSIETDITTLNRLIQVLSTVLEQPVTLTLHEDNFWIEVGLFF